MGHASEFGFFLQIMQLSFGRQVMTIFEVILGLCIMQGKVYSTQMLNPNG